jgi:SAM-dependent methyltransferase
MSFEPRFGQAADAYAIFRPDYPQEILERILAQLAADRRNCAIDLGAGTGKATQMLTPRFARVIAVEPDPLMAAKLREAEPQVNVCESTAEEFDFPEGGADLVNIAQALHWMDTQRVLGNVARWLRPGGVLAVYGFGLPKAPEPLRGIVHGEFEVNWNAFRDSRLRQRDFPQSAVREAAGMRIVEDTTVNSTRYLTAGEFAGFWRSTSYGSAYGRSLGDSEEYWRGLESRFREAWSEDKIPVAFNPYFLLARKEQRCPR